MKKYILTLSFITLLWYIASLLLNQLFLPSPFPVIAGMFMNLASGELFHHLGISLYRIFLALIIAFVPALGLALWAGLNQSIDRYLSPVMYVLFPIPKIALLPLILLLFGLGNMSKIFLVAMIVFFQFFLNIRDEVSQINPSYFASFATLGGRGFSQIRHLVIPAILPRIFSTLRMCLGTSFAVLFMAETFATREGIGYYIMDAWARIAYVDMYGGITALSLTGLILFALLDFFEWLCCPWNRS